MEESSRHKYSTCNSGSSYRHLVTTRKLSQGTIENISQNRRKKHSTGEAVCSRPKSTSIKNKVKTYLNPDEHCNSEGGGLVKAIIGENSKLRIPSNVGPILVRYK